ncbi:ArgE/DapE family deacylase [candidate division KSB3 bacterium]|uniref:Probable succinyl-diaminopimelate desuccinylase n=1 Tax=candidate division KSB3 bacterium TaxID=2044937 RepID=A0A9D5Q6T5_9BACT|nr:ArgE/DapE family deacylase [candidate division KSB3 bacterium]MBD3326204.1 ArgE/DapE family deacylase [candidate division KSB3 bacterium]
MNKGKLIEQICDYIDAEKDNLLSTLKTYINFRSINAEQLLEGEKTEIVECQKWLAAELEKMNYFDKVDYYQLEEGRPNVVGLKQGSGKGRSLLFNGHSDVVTVSEEQQRDWTILSPFDGGVQDGKVWGRGATDMKGGNTAILYAAKALQELGITLNGDLLLTYVDGEESGRAEIGIWSLMERGYTADLGIMAEPTNLHNIYNKSKGEIYFDITIKGASTHICNRYKTIWPQPRKEDQIGVNAIDKMVKLINAFNELERSWGLDYYDPSLDPGSTTLTVSMIRGGESFSAQAGECAITIASMFAPQLSVEDIRSQIVDTIDYVAKHDHWLKHHPPEYAVPFPPKVPLNVPEDDDTIITLVQSYTDVMGTAPYVKPSPFVGDVNYMFEKGIKGVNWGPGDLSMGIHGANEYVPVEQVVTAAKLYAAAAINWCGLVD